MELGDEVMMWLESLNDEAHIALHIATTEPMTPEEFLACLRSYLEEFENDPFAAFEGLKDRTNMLQ